MTSRPAKPSLHASAVELQCGSHRAGVLLQGEPGAGKSALALQLISRPAPNPATGEIITAQLVSDDQVVVDTAYSTVTLSAPQRLLGLLEVRGIGIMRLPAVSSPVPLDIVINHREQHLLERMPRPQCIDIGSDRFVLHHLDFSRWDAAIRVQLICALHWGQVTLLD